MKKTPDEKKDNFARVHVIQQEQINTCVRDSIPVDSRREFQNGVSSQHMFKQLNQMSVSGGDDGYSTDSRSNTTASISSLFSSSLSSLSTYDGSHLSTAGPHNCDQTMNHNISTHTQQGPIQKGANIVANSKANIGKNPGLPVKRRVVKVEEPDNVSSLEDKIRALTTIEEESAVLSMTDRNMNVHNGKDKVGLDAKKMDVHNQTIDIKYNTTNVRNSINFATDSNYLPGYFFRAIPVSTDSPAVVSHKVIGKTVDAVTDRDYIRHANSLAETRASEVFSPSLQVKGENWNDYVHSFGKDCDVHLHNVDEVRLGELSGNGTNNVVGMDIRRQKSPATFRTNSFHNKNDGKKVLSPVMNESSHNQVGHEGGFRKISGGKGDWFSAVGSVDKDGEGFTQDLRSQDKPHVSGYKLKNHAMTLQEYASYDQLLHQQQHQKQQLHQSGSHGQAHLKYIQQHNSLNVLTDSNVSIQPSYTSISPHGSISSIHASVFPDQASWQTDNFIDQQHLLECQKLNQMGLQRNAMSLGNIPDIQRQIRATSELCLQASRKHVFASSADIHKLFSGQKPPTDDHQISSSSCFDSVKRDESNKSVMGTTWSGSTKILQESSKLGSSVLNKATISGFSQIVEDTTKLESYQMLNNSTSSQFSQIAQDSSKPKPKLHVMMPSRKKLSPNPIWTDPIRSTQNIYIPPEAWTYVTSVPNSVSSSEDRIYFQMHNQPLSGSFDLDRPTFQKIQSTCTDSYTDKSQLNCLSSGYSSESELQQIESNAETVKKLVHSQGIEHAITNPIHEFIPLNRSLDCESNTDTDNLDEIMENESFNENQSKLTNAYTVNYSKQPFSPVWSSLRTSTEQQPSCSSITAHQNSTPSVSIRHNVPPYLPVPQAEFQTKSFQTPLLTSSVGRKSDNTHSKNVSQTSSLGSINTSKEVINIINKPIFVTGPVTSHQNIFQDYTYINTNNGNISAATFPSYPTQHISGTLDLSTYNSQGYYSSSDLYSHSEHSKFQGGQLHLNLNQLDYSQRNIRNSFVQLSPVEIAQILDTPFETNVISDEHGDRFSTLV